MVGLSETGFGSLWKPQLLPGCLSKSSATLMGLCDLPSLTLQSYGGNGSWLMSAPGCYTIPYWFLLTLLTPLDLCLYSLLL